MQCGSERGLLSSCLHRVLAQGNKKKKKNRQQAETTLTRSGQPTEAGIGSGCFGEAERGALELWQR